MGMYLSDPLLPELHGDWLFPGEEDFLEGTGTSKIFVRDSNLTDFPLYPGLNMGTLLRFIFPIFCTNRHPE